MANNSSQKIITCHHIQKDLNLKLILAKEKKKEKKKQEAIYIEKTLKGWLHRD
jgi:hypothetical protein